MTSKEKKKYLETDDLRKLLNEFRGMKFNLDCGHRTTFGHHLGNDITIYYGKQLKIICSLCGY